jgi:hypothetical protein
VSGGAGSFVQALAQLRFGRVEAKLSDELAELVRQAQETGKAGELTLKIKVSAHGKQNREIHLTPKISSKLPPLSEIEEPTIFFAAGSGDLTRDDPEQPDIFKERRPTGVANGASPAENSAAASGAAHG